MVSSLAKVSNDQRRVRIELRLRRQVELLNQCGFQVGVPGADITRPDRGRRRKRKAVLCLEEWIRATLLTRRVAEEGRVERKAKVRAGPLEEVCDAVTAANNELAVVTRRRISKTDARHPSVPECVIQRPAGSVLPCNGDCARRDVEVRLLIVRLVQGLVPLPAQSEIQCEIRGNLPVVLEEHSIAPLALSPLRHVRALTESRGLIQQEVCPRIAAAEVAVVIEVTEHTVVAGVVAVRLIADRRDAKLQRVGGHAASSGCHRT